jgi:hypothetical protein
MRMYVENNIRQKHKTNRIVQHSQQTASAAAATTRLYEIQTVGSPTYAETANTATGVGEDDPFGSGLFSCQIQS